MNSDPEQNSIKILSFNLNILPSFSLVLTGDHGYAKDRAEEFLKRIHEYDVLILQEIFSSPHLTYFCQQLRL